MVWDSVRRLLRGAPTRLSVIAVSAVLASRPAEACITFFYEADEVIGSEVVPPTDSELNLSIHVETYVDCIEYEEVIDASLWVSLDTFLIESPVVRLHQGARGENGPMIGEFVPLVPPAQLPIALPISLCPALNDTLVYVVVTSPEYPDGEVRGQLVPRGSSPTLETSWARMKSEYR